MTEAEQVPVEVPEDIVRAGAVTVYDSPVDELCAEDREAALGLARAVLDEAYPLIAARVQAELEAEDECLRATCQQIAATASDVYCAVTGGQLSYPTYDARTILSHANDQTQKLIDDECARVRAEERQRIAGLIRENAGVIDSFARDGSPAGLIAYLIDEVLAAGSAVPVATPEPDAGCERAYGQGVCTCQRRADVDFSHTATGPVATPTEPVDEVKCPDCEATIRARMSDQPEQEPIEDWPAVCPDCAALAPNLQLTAGPVCDHWFHRPSLGEPYEPADCRSIEGETVGLIDAAIHVLRFASRADLTTPAAREALKDFASDAEVQAVIRAAAEQDGQR